LRFAQDDIHLSVTRTAKRDAYSATELPTAEVARGRVGSIIPRPASHAPRPASVRRRHSWLSPRHRRGRDSGGSDGDGWRAHSAIRRTLDKHLRREALRLGDPFDLERDRVDRPSELVVSYLGHRRRNLDPG